jgi:exodeoxyribonuclease VII large subunit
MASGIPKHAEQRRIYSVSELTRDVKLHLESEFFDLWVAGEISNFREHSSGHLYFTLKDSRCQIPAVMFRSAARRLLKFRPADGQAILARGHISVYEPRGAYQLLVEWMEPRGKGALQAAFEQLKEKLSKEGLFDTARKKSLPLLPQRIGIVTSPSGAAIRDICRILERRFPNLEVVLYPAQVQGDLAAAEISKGIQVLNRLGGFDALIIGRGGGSLEDLWPFNEESVARAVAASKVPVISAVGHEVDFTIADFVADVRAPTPSAAAEMVVSRKDEFQERVERLRQRTGQAVRYRMTTLSGRVDRLTGHQAFLAVRHAVQMAGQHLDEASFHARTAMDKRLGDLRSRLSTVSSRLDALRLDRQVSESGNRLRHLVSRLTTGQKARLTLAGKSLSRLSAQLEAMSPLAVLGRGYSLAWDAEGHLLREASAVETGDEVRLTLHRGELDCRVEKRRLERETDETS